MRINPNGATGGEISNLAVDRKGLRNATEYMKADPASWLWIPRHFASRNQRLYLRGEAQHVTVIGIVKRFDAVWIACKKDRVLLLVPNPECVHATEIVAHSRALGGIEMKQHLRIRLCAKDTSCSFELSSQRLVVVNLPIEGDDEFAIGAFHRLRCAIGEVDD